MYNYAKVCFTSGMFEKLWKYYFKIGLFEVWNIFMKVFWITLKLEMIKEIASGYIFFYKNSSFWAFFIIILLKNDEFYPENTFCDNKCKKNPRSLIQSVVEFYVFLCKAFIMKTVFDRIRRHLNSELIGIVILSQGAP